MRLREVVIVCVIFVLAGCEGDDGAAGPPGPAGPTGPVGPPGTSGDGTANIGDATAIQATTTKASAPPATIDFRLTDAAGTPLSGLPAGNISFMIARLVPGSDGNPSQWQSYVTRVESADGSSPDALDSAVQATTENGSQGTLTDHGDGNYTYVFATDLEDAAVPYDPSLTHRVGFEIRGLAPADGNGLYTFRPSDGATTELFSRAIVSTDSCNGCHSRLAFHGGARIETGYCELCHNPGSTDQDSGNTVDFTVMIHKIHMGEHLPSVMAGMPYQIYGFRESENDYSEVLFPQDLRNCRTCHDENDPATADASNWLTVPSIEACGACHDNINFATGAGHSEANLAAGNADCTLCHGQDAFVGPVDESHVILEQLAAQKYQFNIIEVSNSAPGQFPTVRFSVTNPGNNDEPYNILTDDPFLQGGGASRLAIDLGWSTSDYQNTGSGSEIPGFRPGSPAQMVSLNPLSGGSVDNGDGTFSITSTVAIPMGVTGSGLVAVEGHPAEDVDDDGTQERLPVTGATEFFAITDSQPVPRRQVANLDGCLDCHQQISLHGNNRTDNIGLCVGCHNPNATDIRARVEGGIDATTAPDGLDEQSIDFKRMIHQIHAGTELQNGLVVYGFGGSPHDYSHVEFPGSLQDCSKCHLDDSYYPVDSTVLATTIDSGADLGDPYDDLNITPNAAVCSACHDSELAHAHMTQNGGAFDAMQTAEGTLISASGGTVLETCTLCHGPGRTADVREMHGF